jgi:integrase
MPEKAHAAGSSPDVLSAIRAHTRRLSNAEYSDETITHREYILLMVDRWLREHAGRTLLTAATADYDAWLAWLRTTPILGTDRVRSPGTRRTYLAHVRAWADDAELTGWLDRNPLARIRVARPAPNTTDRKPVFPEAAIPAAVGLATEPVRTWLILGLYLGLRLGECRQLRREDVDDLSTPPTIYVRGKGRRNRRMTLSAEVLAALTPWLRATHRGPLFRDRHGGVYERRKASKLVSGHLRALGIPAPITMHSTRHRAVSAAMIAGHRPTAVQAFAGHACLSSTQGYMHEVPDAVAAIVTDLGRGLNQITARPELQLVRGDLTPKGEQQL